VPPNGYSWSVADAARATSAAATYFLPLKIEHGGQQFTFEDAGMFGHNNPSSMAWNEINKIPEFEGRTIGCFLSLGTGVPPALALYSSSKPTKNRWTDWIKKPLKRINKLSNELRAQATQTEGTHDYMYNIFRALELCVWLKCPLVDCLMGFFAIDRTNTSA
jgi:hypothetical protein